MQMIVLYLLFATSMAGVVAAVTMPGLTDLLLLAVPCALASLLLIASLLVRPAAKPASWPKRLSDPLPPKWIVVDGSNVMYWKDGTPQIGTVREVIQYLTALGFAPGVVFDANAGYKFAGFFHHDGALGQLLGLPQSRVMVVAKGIPADITVLAAARDLGARIVTNDRYRDWYETHPEAREPGHLSRGGYREGKLWLDVN